MNKDVSKKWLIFWYFFIDKDELFENGHYEILASGDLLVVGVGTSDEGKYTCMRANEAGSVSGDAWLSILGEY